MAAVVLTRYQRPTFSTTFGAETPRSARTSWS